MGTVWFHVGDWGKKKILGGSQAGYLIVKIRVEG